MAHSKTWSSRMSIGPFVALLLAACAEAAPADDTAASAAAAVEAMTTAVQDAVVRRDPATIGALFADDAVLLEPDGRVLDGRLAIEARIAELMPRVQGYSLTSQR